MSQPQTLRWGIIATGGISKTFSLDLLIDPKTRDVTDVKHQIVAVGSRSVESAKKFITTNNLGENVNACGSYQEVYDHQDVDCVYIGSPHSHHYENAKDALSAGKHVLCEKALVVNQKQAEILFDLAKKKDVFFMEAVWTRFFPVAIHFQKLIADGEIGDVQRVFGDLSIDMNLDKMDPSSRMIDPELAGGALLDLGPYSLNFILLSLFPHPAPIPKSTIKANMVKFKTGVDLCTAATLTFEGKEGAIACLSNSMSHKGPRCLVQGTKGEIEWEGLPFRPTGLIVRDKEGKETHHSYPSPENGAGMFWEADEVARCIFAGKKESPRMTHAHSLAIMGIFDRIREEGGLRYPNSIEKL